MQTLRKSIAAAVGTAACLALAGCTVGPSFSPPQPISQSGFWPHAAPATSASGQAAASEPAISQAVSDPVDPHWWRLFNDPILVGLEQRLAAANLDLQLATERLGQSRAQLRIIGADALPTLDANGSYTRERPSARGVLSLFSGGGGGGGGSFASQGSSANGLSGTQGGIPTGGIGGAIPPFDLFQYGFDASWELDLWGHARRETEAARADVQAAQDQGRNALVSTEAELARDYINLRGLQQRDALTRADLDAFMQTLRLTRERARAGLTTALDVSNSTAQLNAAQAQLPPLIAQQQQLRNALCLLLGEQPGALDPLLDAPTPVPPVPPRVGIGLASELARRRPDIRAAEAQLHAATAEVGVAVADFFPKFTLSGSIGLQALLAKDLGNWGARQYGFGPSVSLPLFQGGRLRGTLALRRGQQREAAISYRRTVLAAFGDVSNALAAYQQEQARRAALSQAVDANEQSVRLSRLRYRQGIASFIDVLDAQREQLQTQQMLAESTATVSTDLVALFKAIGGGWDQPQGG